jgi:hypothetical protein
MTRKELYFQVYLTVLPSIIRNFSDPHEGSNPRYIAEETSVVTSAVMHEMEQNITSAGEYFDEEKRVEGSGDCAECPN